jgi:FkbM family methyltransferase
MDKGHLYEVIKLPNGREIAHLDRRETAFIYHEIFVDEKYLSHGIDISSEGVVVDVGANIGLFSLYVKQRAPNAKVFAIEPISEIVNVLRRNLRDVPRCRVLPIGLSNEEGTAELTYFPKSPGMSSRYADIDHDRRLIQTVLGNTNQTNGRFAEFSLNRRLRGRPVRCTLRRFSSVLDDEGIREIDLVKIDVEKSELEVLDGIDDRHWPGIRQLVIEVHDFRGRLSEIVGGLERRGYVVHTQQDPLFQGTDVNLVYAQRESGR